MEDTSDKAARYKMKRKSVKIRMTLVIIVVLAAGLLIAGFFYPQGLRGITNGLIRAKNTFSFIVLKQKPHFYALILEKNGKDYRLTAADSFEVSYRDEFVVKDIVTDVLFGGGVTVDAEGMGDKNDIGKLLKGIDLVDKTVLADRSGTGGKSRSVTPF